MRTTSNRSGQPEKRGAVYGAYGDLLAKARSEILTEMNDPELVSPMCDVLRSTLEHIQGGADSRLKASRAAWSTKKIAEGLRNEFQSLKELPDTKIKSLLLQLAHPEIVLSEGEVASVQNGKFSKFLLTFLANSERAALVLTALEIDAVTMSYLQGKDKVEIGQYTGQEPVQVNKSLEYARNKLVDFFADYGITKATLVDTLKAIKDKASKKELIQKFSSHEDAVEFYFETKVTDADKYRAILSEYVLEKLPSEEIAKKHGLADSGSVSSLNMRIKRNLENFFTAIGFNPEKAGEALEIYLGGERQKRINAWFTALDLYLNNDGDAPLPLTLHKPRMVPVERLLEKVLGGVSGVKLEDIERLDPIDISRFGKGLVLYAEGGKEYAIVLLRSAIKPDLQPHILDSLRGIGKAANASFREMALLIAGDTPINLTLALQNRKTRKSQKVIRDIKILPEPENTAPWSHRVHIPDGYPYESVKLRCLGSQALPQTIMTLHLHEGTENGSLFGSLHLVKRSKGANESIDFEVNWINRPWMRHREVQGRLLLDYVRGKRVTKPAMVIVPISYKGVGRVAYFSSLELLMSDIPEHTEALVLATFSDSRSMNRLLAFWPQSEQENAKLPKGILFQNPDTAKGLLQIPFKKALARFPELAGFSLEHITLELTKNSTLTEKISKEELEPLFLADPANFLRHLMKEKVWSTLVKNYPLQESRIGSIHREMFRRTAELFSSHYGKFLESGMFEYVTDSLSVGQRENIEIITALAVCFPEESLSQLQSQQHPDSKIQEQLLALIDNIKLGAVVVNAEEASMIIPRGQYIVAREKAKELFPTIFSIQGDV